MADNSPGQDWRQANKKTPAGAAPGKAPGKGKRDWQKQTLQPTGPRKPWSRGSKLFAAVVALSVLFGGIYWVIELLRPISPACLVLLGASYDENLALPPNVYGWKNLDDLHALKDQTDVYSEAGVPTVRHRSSEMKGDKLWEADWAKNASAIREKTIVAAAFLHGAADNSGPYFLLSDDAGVYAKLPFDAFLKTLETGTAQKNVVLILEPALFRSHWVTGILQNDFVAKLIDMKAKLKPNLFILCASDVNQISWSSEEWRQTVFGHFLVEGLKGAADLDGNTRVTAEELFRFVKDKVVAWSLTNRGIEQTPIFLGDESAAREIELAQISATYKDPGLDAAPGLNFNPPESLELSWDGWQKLRSMTPHPAVYSPALWRRYQEMLVRYEQLLRAGDPTKKAGDLHGKLVNLEKKLRTEARFDAADTTLSLSLPMADALGVPLPLPEADVRKRIQQIWDAAKDEQRPEFMKDMVDWSKKQDDVKMSQLRVEAYRSYLALVTQSPVVREADLLGSQNEKDDSRSKVEAILDLFDVKLGPPRPAEVHYLTMLLKDVSRKPAPDADQLKRAVKLRQFAERAALAVPEGRVVHPYSEVVYPWNAARIARADSLRRPGEDYLFGSTKDDWVKSSRFFDDAEAEYAAAQKESADFQTALRLRDLAAADLPHFAHWVANQRVSSDKGHTDRVESWTKQVVALSQRLEQLQTELAKEKAGPSTTALRGLVEPVEESWKNLKKHVEEETGKVSQAPHLPPLWLDREAILSVPPLLGDESGSLAVEQRLALLRYNRITSASLFKKTESAPIVGTRAKDDAELLAKRSQQLAVAVVKPFYAAEFANADAESIAATGDLLARTVKQWPGDVNDGVSQSQKEGDLNAALRSLKKADALARGLPAGFDEKADPMSASQALRSLRMHDLLVNLARRTLLDHWYSEVQDGQPYYETAARGYLNVASQLARVKDAPRELNKLRERDTLKLAEAIKASPLEIDGKTSDFWTSEKEFPVRWSIKSLHDVYSATGDDEKAPPRGVAVSWRKLDGPGDWKDAATPNLRKCLELPAAAGRADGYFLAKSNADDAALKATYNVLLRGQRKSATIEVSQKDPDVVVHTFPPPAKSFVKVRMDPQFTYGAVSIALDISGSMIWKNGWGIDTPAGRKTRLELALVALETALKIIPETTYVGIVAFYTKDGEKTPQIVDVLPPAAWNRDRIQPVLTKINDIAANAWKEVPQAFGSTPIAYTVVEAYRRGFPAAGLNFRGPKVILVLSDGDDTSTPELLKAQWPAVGTPAYDKKVASYVTDELGNKDAEIQFICFLDEQKYAAEAKHAREQFKVVEEFRNPGRFIIQPDPLLLADELQKAIRPRLILEKGTVAPPGYHPEGEFVSLPRDEFNWIPVPEGQYTVRVKGSPPRDLKINPGDMIPIVLRRDPNDPKKIVYERESFADFSSATIPLLADGRVDGDRYRVAVMQNQPTAKANLLTQLIDVEEATKGARLIQQTEPRFVWIESKPKSQPPPRMLRWFREFGYPSLTYRAIGYDWPAPAAVVATPEIQVWATDSPDRDTFARPLEWTTGKSKESKSKIVKLDADQYATIEDVALEDKEVVPDASGKVGAKTASKQCLVVRVQHPPGKPVYVQYQGAHRGEEHRYYQSASKYTAIFWDLGPSNTDNHAFNVIFLDALKKDSPPVSFTVTGRNSNFPPPMLIGN